LCIISSSSVQGSARQQSGTEQTGPHLGAYAQEVGRRKSEYADTIYLGADHRAVSSRSPLLFAGFALAD
jgi:hypothetical protein